MHEAVTRMLAKYEPKSVDDSVRALREIIQEVALLGLWRAKFFEHAAFYGGTALRILYGLDRFSEDLDFSLLTPSPDFNLARYTASLEEELLAFGFNVRVEMVDKAVESAVQSAFLKANTRNELLVIEAGEELAGQVAAGQVLKVKIEVDTDPPPGFNTSTRYLLQPIPFAVRSYTLPDLFAGKMHAILYRKWKNRVKGRDWYDFVWYAANHPQLNLAHLEQRMRQTGHWNGEAPLSSAAFRDLLFDTITRLDVNQARKDVAPFVNDQQMLTLWSHDFFHDVAGRIQTEG
ncbi:nucleotidyl transferase AbiEii/AbiGii toxin family protein [Geobacter pelophilus]|uniref:Nucleotidyl transferase AbiEii/AbiGii toxin family protein n=1 Tax=Geoanaerobacter pelophilus TaxID=60036 RepID=A0AAW4L7A4_9BACT|nr:nucleotidyl transferase AbiEii/AbiGii toxin family protein [Geoanaerobacter pelophilus]MBT0663131.1 nucleotidyl transferase AbiEii/AbiGii toxin family protein [Geoanaerobacter pelophilus]